MNPVSTRRLLTMIGCAAALGVFPACNEADPVPTSSGSIALSVQASTAGTGRYETATFTLAQIQVRPVDALGDAVFASTPITLTITRVPGNLAPGASAFTVTTALPAGRYRVDTLGIAPAQLVDTTVPLPAPGSCIENLAAVPASTGAQIPGITYFSFQLTDPDWVFEIGPGAQQLVFTVDAPAFVSLVESAFTCDDSSGTATLTAFDSAAYQNGLLPLLGLRK